MNVTMPTCAPCSPTLTSRDGVSGLCASTRALPAEGDQFLGMFCQGQTEGVDGPLHLVDIKMGQGQRIVEQDAFPCLIEHKGPMHEGAIHPGGGVERARQGASARPESSVRR